MCSVACWEQFQGIFRGGKRCEQCERCSCKDFPTVVKILVKNVIKGGVKNFSPKLYLKNVIKGGVKQLETKSVCDCDYFTRFHPVSLCFTLFFNLFDIKFVANRAIWVALNLSESRTFGVNFWVLKNPLV